MMRLFFVLVVAGLVAVAAAWIADNDAAMLVTAGNYEIRTTVGVAIILLLVSFAVLWLFLRILFGIVAAFARAGAQLSRARRGPPVSAQPADSRQTAPAQSSGP
ncbi:MAG TPA: heme biosynthesis HemY N-terminal domain-containing protein [Micropepsaceae bacterium]|jgi:uncharacterized protein HemY|nr:heme biosynthesis HemY N-terminal domain-containing protein [Micropepsaceae bacterium]